MLPHRFQFLVGIDLGRWLHQACVLDAKGEFVAEAGFPHSREGLSETVGWLLSLAKNKTDHLAVAIEKPHGAVVETLLARGLAVFAVNPKQVDRFRDRHSLSGAKDDRRGRLRLSRCSQNGWPSIPAPATSPSGVHRLAPAPQRPRSARQAPRRPRLSDSGPAGSMPARPFKPGSSQSSPGYLLLRAPRDVLRPAPPCSRRHPGPHPQTSHPPGQA